MFKFRILKLLAVLVMLLPIGYLAYFNYPRIVYAVYPDLLQQQIDQIAETSFSTEVSANIATPEPIVTAETNPQVTITIPAIGVQTQVIESPASDPDLALSKGVWRLPAHGNFESVMGNPTVLAAHRWGDINLTDDYRNKNLFINLPSLQIGDLITIEKDNKILTYRVNLVENSTTINKLNDLILVTCQYLDSPYRVIVYANEV